jgi:hypothetical protein
MERAMTDAILKPPPAALLLAFELRDAWRAARDEARRAYVVWRDAPRSAKSDAYTAYRAAADREDAAAEAYARPNRLGISTGE